MSLSSYMKKYLTTIKPRHYEQYNNEMLIITKEKDIYKRALKYIKKHFKNRYETYRNNREYTIRTFGKVI